MINYLLSLRVGNVLHKSNIPQWHRPQTSQMGVIRKGNKGILLPFKTFPRLNLLGLFQISFAIKSF